ncbi:caspase family protein [Clostridium sp. JS66]|uniref:caspase family protein n=1 Tax=Clostridium sp. JS66 TaxID=3064705 RepID=UPI00298DC704|nr:caspase family protein [Clostridium sp. JS66]WPC42383.1 caspase family protein [Clostridium sp. JS66]
MQKRAIIFSAGEYLNSLSYPKPKLDLQGVKCDVLAIEKRLNQIGFNVIRKDNVCKSEYFSTLKKSVENCPSDAIHIVYFSGHGGHYNGKNYIYPSDFAVRYDRTKDVDDASINIKDIISVFKDKGKLILILDACRNDFGVSKGYYSEMASAENVYIAYGTMFQSSSIATNRMSWFTEAICDEILTPNIDVDSLFTQVRQNILRKHHAQIPPSVTGLLEGVVLHSELSYDDDDKKVYDFVQKYGDEYTDKYGYFHGDDLIFIDASQYFDIGLLDAIWKFRKVSNKIFKNTGISVPELTEAKEKLVIFLGFTRSQKFFTCDESHTWYYNGRQIRMGEIPPLPPSMQRKLPEQGKEFYVNFDAKKEEGNIIIKTNLPDQCEIFIWDNKSNFSKNFIVTGGKITITDADEIKRVRIDSGIFTSNRIVQQILGDKCRNLVGKYVKYHPIHGNQLTYLCEF